MARIEQILENSFTQSGSGLLPDTRPGQALSSEARELERRLDQDPNRLTRFLTNVEHMRTGLARFGRAYKREANDFLHSKEAIQAGVITVLYWLILLESTWLVPQVVAYFSDPFLSPFAR